MPVNTSVDTVDCEKLYLNNSDFKKYVDGLLHSYAYKGYTLKDVLSLRLTKEYGSLCITGRNTYSASGAYNMYANSEA